MIFLRRFALRHLFNRRGWQPEGESFDTRMDFAFGGGMHNRSRRKGPKLGPKPVLWDFQGVSLRNWKRSQDWNLVLVSAMHIQHGSIANVVVMRSFVACICEGLGASECHYSYTASTCPFSALSAINAITIT